jgi:hypothetical protein
MMKNQFPNHQFLVRRNNQNATFQRQTSGYQISDILVPLADSGSKDNGVNAAKNSAVRADIFSDAVNEHFQRQRRQAPL